MRLLRTFPFSPQISSSNSMPCSRLGPGIHNSPSSQAKTRVPPAAEIWPWLTEILPNERLLSPYCRSCPVLETGDMKMRKQLPKQHMAQQRRWTMTAPCDTRGTRKPVSDRKPTCSALRCLASNPTFNTFQLPGFRAVYKYLLSTHNG